ncbi:MAG: hypothetical protein IPP94_18955 [Ignavibacteria bacterium]|nr:hypothetical protein [Ignavibacteria bacterium]
MKMRVSFSVVTPSDVEAADFGFRIEDEETGGIVTPREVEAADFGLKTMRRVMLSACAEQRRRRCRPWSVLGFALKKHPEA